MFSLVLKNNYRKNDYNRKLFLKTLFKKIIFKNCFKNHYRSHSNWLPNHLFLSNEMGKSGEMMSILLFQNTKKKKPINQREQHLNKQYVHVWSPIISTCPPCFPLFHPPQMAKNPGLSSTNTITFRVTIVG